MLEFRQAARLLANEVPEVLSATSSALARLLAAQVRRGPMGATALEVWPGPQLQRLCHLGL